MDPGFLAACANGDMAEVIRLITEGGHAEPKTLLRGIAIARAQGCDDIVAYLEPLAESPTGSPPSPDPAEEQQNPQPRVSFADAVAARAAESGGLVSPPRLRPANLVLHGKVAEVRPGGVVVVATSLLDDSTHYYVDLGDADAATKEFLTLGRYVGFKRSEEGAGPDGMLLARLW